MAMLPRILMVIHQFRPSKPGGAEVQAERLAEKLVKRGHEVSVLTQLRNQEAPSFEVFRGFKIFRSPFALGYKIFSGFHQFAFLIRYRRSYDVLHVHQAFGHALVSIIAARLLRKPCLVKIGCAGEFGDLIQFSRLRHSGIGLRILRQADAIVAISHDIERELYQWNFPIARILYLPNGIDSRVFKRDRPWEESLPVETTSPWRIALVGRRHPQKGIDVAIAALKFLREREPACKLELHSYGVDYPEIDYRICAREAGVSDQVFFHDFENDMWPILAGSHVFLLPSRAEGLSNALLEAMAMELPVIATSVSGNIDLIRSGWNGLLVPTDDPVALGNALLTIWKNHSASAVLGRRARRTVDSLFSLDYITAQYSSLYNRLLKDMAK